MKRILSAVVGGSADSWYISPESYGAVGDGIADDTQALQDAIVAAKLGTLCVKLTTGKIYRITGAVTIDKSGFRLIGGNYLAHAQADGGYIKCDGATAMLKIEPTSGYLYRNIVNDVHFRGVNGALTAIKVTSAEEFAWQRVSAWGFGGKAYDFSGVHLSSFDWLVSTVNSIGVYLHNCANNSFHKPNIYGSENQITTPTEAGFKFSGSSGNNMLIAPWFENNRVALLFTNALADLKCDQITIIDGQFSAYFNEQPGTLARIVKIVNETDANKLNVRPIVFDRCMFSGSSSSGALPYFFEINKNTCTASASEIRGLFVIRNCMCAGTAPSTAWALSDDANTRILWSDNLRGNAVAGETILSGSGSTIGLDCGGTFGLNSYSKHRGIVVVGQQDAAAGVANGSIFEDTADGKLKYKNLAGSVQILAN